MLAVSEDFKLKLAAIVARAVAKSLPPSSIESATAIAAQVVVHALSDVEETKEDLFSSVFGPPPDEESEEPECETMPVPVFQRKVHMTRLERVAAIRKLCNTDEPAPTAGTKRKYAAFSDFSWEQIKGIYEDNGCLMEFKPAEKSVPDDVLDRLTKNVKDVIDTSNPVIMSWNETVVDKMVDLVLRAAATAADGQSITVEGQQNLTNDELGLNGRADMMVTKGSRRIVVVECKRGEGSWSQGLAQMALAAECVLSDKIAQDANTTECVYGLLAHCMEWTWFRLDKNEGRIHSTCFVPKLLKPTLAEQSGIAFSILSELPAIKVPSKNKDKRAKRA